MAPWLRVSAAMSLKRVGPVGATVVLAGFMLVGRCHHPVPSAALVEIVPGTVAESDRTIMKELVAAFDRVEVAMQQADLDAVMRFYAEGYNYHGLKRPAVRRVWEEVFSHYGQITSKHVFTEFKLVKAGSGQQAYVTCTGGLYGTAKESGKPVTIDSWAREVHSLVKVKGEWKFLGNVSARAPAAPPASAPHHLLF